jgi:hypothetical protein
LATVDCVTGLVVALAVDEGFAVVGLVVTAAAVVYVANGAGTLVVDVDSIAPAVDEVGPMAGVFEVGPFPPQAPATRTPRTPIAATARSLIAPPLGRRFRGKRRPSSSRE